jgi:hypothetical protein
MYKKRDTIIYNKNTSVHVFCGSDNMVIAETKAKEENFILPNEAGFFEDDAAKKSARKILDSFAEIFLISSGISL